MLPGSSDPLVRSTYAALLVAVGTALAYGATLAWDTQYDVAADGSSSGPYADWQVALLVALLALIVGVAAWCRHAVVAASVTTVALVLCWTMQASEDDSGLWVIGAFLLFVGASVGFSLLALAASYASDRWRARAPQAHGSHELPS